MEENLKLKTFGIGYMGIGKFNSTNNTYYSLWATMFSNSYNQKVHESCPGFIGYSVDPIWHDFQNFAQWCEKNEKQNYHFTKDILIKGNKIYGPDTCCFIPEEINNFLYKNKKKSKIYPIGIVRQSVSIFKAEIKFPIGIKIIGHYKSVEYAFEQYKIVKEDYVRRLAIKYADKISPPIYQALMNYTVSITD